MGSAHIWALCVDSTRPLGVEKGAGSRRVRDAFPEELSVVLADLLCLDFEDGEVVAAALGAAAPTLEASAVSRFEHLRSGVDIGVQLRDGSQRFVSRGRHDPLST